MRIVGIWTTANKAQSIRSSKIPATTMMTRSRTKTAQAAAAQIARARSDSTTNDYVPASVANGPNTASVGLGSGSDHLAAYRGDHFAAASGFGGIDRDNVPTSAGSIGCDDDVDGNVSN
jgi:hypothetical protein